VETKSPKRKRSTKGGEKKTTTKSGASSQNESIGAAGSVEHLAKAPPDKAFWVVDGPVLTDLQQLRDALAREISEEQFVYHVTEGKNDFARWVEEVLGDRECASALREAHNRNEALLATETRLAPLHA